jgi:threonyl-tRNA synthetase
MGIIGDREADSEQEMLLSLRTREGNDLGQMSLNQFLNLLKENIDNCGSC